MRSALKRRPFRLLALLAVLMIALAPLAEARPGGGGSMGSRGMRTYSTPPSTNTAPGYGRPMERSMTEPSRPSYQAMPNAAPRALPGAGMRSPFMAGLFGGLLGAGIGGLLFGHGLFGGISGFGSILGLLIQIGIVVLLVRFALSWWRRRQPDAMAANGMRMGAAGNGPQGGPAGGPMGSAGQAYQREANPGSYGNGSLGGYGGMAGGGASGGGASGGAAAAGSALSLQPGDFQIFEQSLKDVNAAWSRRDLGALQRLCTPEMVQYFSEEMTDLQSRGLVNQTSDVRLEQGDLSEAWSEQGREYATLAMRFSLIDVTRRQADGMVVEGDAEQRQEATELWTFVRSRGGQWLLSAVQQTGK